MIRTLGAVLTILMKRCLNMRKRVKKMVSESVE
jgi:hypothetical protein